MAKKKEFDKEIRCIGTCKRSTEDSRVIEGVAISFNSDSQDIGWIERILPEAVNDELIKKSDIIMNIDHTPSRLLARSRYGKGSLQTWIESDGVHFRFEAPKTATGDEALELLDRGDLYGCSFCFVVSDEDDAEEWVFDPSIGRSRRYIKKIERLFDYSLVTEPCFLASKASTRSAENIEDIMCSLNALQAELDDLAKVEL